MAAPVLLPLRDGDQLTRDEFMRRWEAMPDLKFAELLDGIVHLPLPVSLTHSDFHAAFSAWLTTYVAGAPACRTGLEGTWLMDERNVPQPDCTLRILPEFGGQSRVDGDYTAGAPELIVEVAASRCARDLGVKLRLYERMGVREYLVALTGTKKLLWNTLSAGRYIPIEADADGVLRSRCFPGLWLDPVALWQFDLPKLLDSQQR